MPQIPERLVNFRVYGGPDATLDFGMSDVELPKFEAMTETIKGAGIAGELESVTIGHFQSMMVKLKWRAVRAQTLALLAPVSMTLDIRGSIQMQDSAGGPLVTSPLRVAVRGQVKSKGLGKLEPGKPLDAESDVEVAAISIYVDSQPIVELDKLNSIFRVNGFDYLRQVRTDLGQG